MLKAAAGGGGKGIESSFKESCRNTLLPAQQKVAKAAFGNDDMYLEKLVISTSYRSANFG